LEQIVSDTSAPTDKLGPFELVVIDKLMAVSDTFVVAGKQVSAGLRVYLCLLEKVSMGL